MRQTIRALGWTVTISTVVLSAFLATAVYSVFQMVMMERNIGFGGFKTSFSGNRLVLSVPITVNNTGYYDMTNLKMTTTLKDYSGKTLATSTSGLGEIKKGSPGSISHNLSLSLDVILSEMSYLLFNDTEFRIDFAVGFNYAYALGFQLALVNTSIPWDAPLYGLELKGFSPPHFNGTHLAMSITLEVENHSFLDISGDLSLEVYNQMDKRLGSGKGLIHVPSNSRISGPVEIVVEVENLNEFTGKGYLKANLELPMIGYSFELGRVDYG